MSTKCQHMSTPLWRPFLTFDLLTKVVTNLDMV